MRTLFVKIFIWFWLATGVIGAVFFLVAVVSHNDVQFVPWRRMISGAVSVYGQSAIGAYEKDGKAAAETYLENVRRSSGVRGCLMNEAGVPLVGAPPLSQLHFSEIAKSQTEVVQFEVQGTVIVSAQRIVNQGGVYLFASTFDRPLFPFYGGGNQSRAVRFLTAFLTAGLVCYGLARYLAAPVSRLRDATRRLAAGDLEARVGPAIGKRRDELADLSRDFDVMAERIETLVLSQRRLLGDISHELRSPLTRLGLALSLARRKAGAEATESLDRIEREAARLNDLIGQLLSLAHLEGEVAVASAEPVALSPLLHEIVADADFEARSQKRSAQLTVENECFVHGSPELLRRALENIIRNAIRYAPEETAVDVRLACVAEKRTDAVCISIRDQGPGVPEADIRNIFQPFYRVAMARDRASGGVGLGLAIADRAVRLHGGNIAARNLLDGFCVEVHLPVRSIDTDVPPA